MIKETKSTVLIGCLNQVVEHALIVAKSCGSKYIIIENKPLIETKKNTNGPDFVKVRYIYHTTDNRNHPARAIGTMYAIGDGGFLPNPLTPGKPVWNKSNPPIISPTPIRAA